MAKIIVCCLSQLERHIEDYRPRHMVSLLAPGGMIDTPSDILPDNHLRLAFNDIPEPREGYEEPRRDHVETLLAFSEQWDGDAPLLLHCWAGVSRSTAAAYILWYHLTRKTDDHAARGAALIRELSPTATPNPLLVRHADDILNAGGAMNRAIAHIGRGADAFEGVPFELEIKN